MPSHCFHMPVQRTTWLCYDLEIVRAVHAAHRTRRWWRCPMADAPRPSGFLEIRTSDVIAPGVGEVAWGDRSRAAGVEPAGLYLIMDPVRFEAMARFAQGLGVVSPVTGRPVRFLSLPVMGGGSLCLGLYDDLVHAGRPVEASRRWFEAQRGDLHERSMRRRGLDPRVTIRSTVREVGPDEP